MHTLSCVYYKSARKPDANHTECEPLATTTTHTHTLPRLVEKQSSPSSSTVFECHRYRVAEPKRIRVFSVCVRVRVLQVLVSTQSPCVRACVCPPVWPSYLQCAPCWRWLLLLPTVSVPSVCVGVCMCDYSERMRTAAYQSNIPPSDSGCTNVAEINSL